MKEIEMNNLKPQDIAIFQLLTNNVWVETKSKSECQQIIKSIQEAGLLGENIVIGTYFPDNFSIDNIEYYYVSDNETKDMTNFLKTEEIKEIRIEGFVIMNNIYKYPELFSIKVI